MYIVYASAIGRWLKLGPPPPTRGGGAARSLEICEVVCIADAIHDEGSTIEGWKFWNLEPLERDFPYSEPTFTTNFAVSTAQILRKQRTKYHNLQ